MISKQDILDRAVEWQLRPEIVEKDYVLGWLLVAFAQHPQTAGAWVFKGGTCIKKCFFETYRFSEDLDFSLRPGAAYTVEGLTRVVTEVAAITADLSGIEVPPGQIIVQPRRDKLKRDTFLAKLAYRGPLKMPTWPKLSFDITAHEPVLDQTAARPIFHPYPDGAFSKAAVECYSLEELFAEKCRALFERTRPRDLYDVVYMSANTHGLLRVEAARGLFKRKCEVKGKVPPTAAELALLVRGSAELRGDWDVMLAHQLPNLPPIDSVLDRLDDALAWMADVDAPEPPLAAAPVRSGAVLTAPRGMRYWGEGVRLEIIRFGGMNRLLVSFRYGGKTRLVEPYSLRRPSTGNLLLYAWEVSSAAIKSFNVAEIADVASTQTPFVPRYRIELTSME